MPQNPRTSPRANTPSRKKIEAMKANGQKKATVQGNDNKTAIFNSFLSHVASTDDELGDTFGADFESVPETVLGAQDIWAQFATYITDVYIVSAGRKKDQAVGVGTAQGLWTGMVNQARGRCCKSSQPVRVSTPQHLTARLTILSHARARTACAISRDCVG